MESNVDPETISRLHALAANQHHVFTTVQAAELGIPNGSIVHLVDRGWIRPVRRGVYAVSGAPQSSWEPLMAAALAGGPNAVLSHLSAATIHRFHGIAPADPELTHCPPVGRAMSGVRIHRARDLVPADIEARSGVRLTRPVRTVIDIAPRFEDYLLGRILDDGATRRLWTAEEIAGRLELLGTARRAGALRLQRLLAVRMGEGNPDGHLEQRVLRLLKGQIPPPVLHHQIVLDDQLIDMDLCWPDIQLDGEIDGLGAHSQRSDFDRERLRGNILDRHGWHVVRWTSSMDDAVILAQVAPYFDDRAS